MIRLKMTAGPKKRKWNDHDCETRQIIELCSKYVHILARKQNNAITNKKKTRRLADDNSGS